VLGVPGCLPRRPSPIRVHRSVSGRPVPSSRVQPSSRRVSTVRPAAWWSGTASGAGRAAAGGRRSRPGRRLAAAGPNPAHAAADAAVDGRVLQAARGAWPGRPATVGRSRAARPAGRLHGRGAAASAGGVHPSADPGRGRPLGRAPAGDGAALANDLAGGRSARSRPWWSPPGSTRRRRRSGAPTSSWSPGSRKRSCRCGTAPATRCTSSSLASWRKRSWRSCNAPDIRPRPGDPASRTGEPLVRLALPPESASAPGQAMLGATTTR
jgi:hypothetical protein